MKKSVSTRPVIDRRKVVICHEKHGNIHFVVDNDKELFKVALSIIKGRLKAEYFYYPPGDPPAPLEYTHDTIKQLPASLQRQALHTLATRSERMREYGRELELWNEIQEAITTNDGRLAWQILRDRSDGEYERVSLENVYTTYDEET